MKKMYSLWVLLVMALTTATFVSCDTEDEYEAATLEGAWEGNMGVVFGGYRSVRSVIYFDRNPYRYASGTGYQADFFNTSSWYSNYRNNYVANHIDWKVRNGVIEIYYREEDVYAEIREYSLNNGYFEGYIDYEDGSSSYFHLMKTYTQSNWDSYYDWGWYDYYYSKPSLNDFGTRAAGQEGTKPAIPKRSAATGEDTAK